MQPQVSFLVPCYNYGRFLGQAIDSLLSQTLGDLEIIVIDDASTDETAGVLAAYAAEPRVRSLRHAHNRGHIRSYNEGLALAKGRYVGILSADDFCLRTDAVERQVALFEQHPHVGMVYSAHVMLAADGAVIPVRPFAQGGVRSGLAEFRALMWGNYVLHSGTLLRHEVQAALGPYDPTLPQSGDWDLWLRAAAAYDVGYVAEPLYAYRQHPTNMQHAGLAPAAQADQNWRTLNKAFAALPAEAPREVWQARPAALKHALLQTAWFDLYNRRHRRAWQGARYALRRSPAVAASPELWRFLARLSLLTMLGIAVNPISIRRQHPATRGTPTLAGVEEVRP
jgi:hypothetical protein